MFYAEHNEVLFNKAVQGILLRKRQAAPYGCCFSFYTSYEFRILDGSNCSVIEYVLYVMESICHTVKKYDGEYEYWEEEQRFCQRIFLNYREEDTSLQLLNIFKA